MRFKKYFPIRELREIVNEQESLLRYLQQHILRSEEELSPGILESSVDSIIDIPIVKRTARTYRHG